MRAAVFHGVGLKLAIEERQRPAAGPGEVVIRVAFSGICGSDLHATEKSLVPLEAGTVLGHEFAGEVVETGSADWQVGDRVIGVPLRESDECRPQGVCREGLGILCPRNRIVGMSATVPGAYAEYVRLGARHALRVPDGIGLREAALAEPLAAGAHAARRARAEGFGATALIDPGEERLPAAHARHGAVLPQVIFECVGVPGLLQDCIALAPTRGRVVVVGVNRGEDVILTRVGSRKELSL